MQSLGFWNLSTYNFSKKYTIILFLSVWWPYIHCIYYLTLTRIYPTYGRPHSGIQKLVPLQTHRNQNIHDWLCHSRSSNSTQYCHPIPSVLQLWDRYSWTAVLENDHYCTVPWQTVFQLHHVDVFCPFCHQQCRDTTFWQTHIMGRLSLAYYHASYCRYCCSQYLSHLFHVRCLRLCAYVHLVQAKTFWDN